MLVGDAFHDMPISEKGVGQVFFRRLCPHTIYYPQVRVIPRRRHRRNTADRTTYDPAGIE